MVLAVVIHISVPNLSSVRSSSPLCPALTLPHIPLESRNPPRQALSMLCGARHPPDLASYCGICLTEASTPTPCQTPGIPMNYSTSNSTMQTLEKWKGGCFLLGMPSWESPEASWVRTGGAECDSFSLHVSPFCLFVCTIFTSQLSGLFSPPTLRPASCWNGQLQCSNGFFFAYSYPLVSPAVPECSYLCFFLPQFCQLCLCMFGLHGVIINYFPRRPLVSCKPVTASWNHENKRQLDVCIRLAQVSFQLQNRLYIVSPPISR